MSTPSPGLPFADAPTSEAVELTDHPLWELLTATPQEGPLSSPLPLGARPPGSFRGLDYSAGSPLNPLLGNGLPSVNSLIINVPANTIVEYNDADQTETHVAVSDRLGGNYRVNENFVITLSQTARVYLGGGNDVVRSSLVWSTEIHGQTTHALYETAIDGGAGTDAIEVQAGSGLAINLQNTTLTNLEALQFAPDATATQLQDILLSFGTATALPFSKVIGSDGIDVVRIEMDASVAQARELDLRPLAFTDFDDQIQVGDRVSFDLVTVYFSPPVPQVDPSVSHLYANSDVRLTAELGRSNIDVVGSNADDRFHVPLQSQAADNPGSLRIDGGGLTDAQGQSLDFDVVVMYGRHDDYTYLANGSVHGQPVDFRLQDKRPATVSVADGFLNVELFSFADGYFTPQQLAGGITPQLPTVIIYMQPGQDRVTEGTLPQPGGTINFQLLRSGDLGQFSTVEWRLVPGIPVDHPASADDLDVAMGQTFSVTFIPGQDIINLAAPLRPDGMQEPDESLYIELQSAQGAKLGGNSLQKVVIVNDDGFDFSIAGSASAAEGQPFALTLTPLSTFGFFGADGYAIDWGDGTAAQLLSAVELLASNGVVSHVFADGAAPAGTSMSVSVNAADASPTGVTHHHALTVTDLPPTLYTASPAVGDAGSLYAVYFGSYQDVAGDPLQQVRIDWGDGTQSVVLPAAGQAHHVYSGLANVEVKAYAVNDDGEFLVETQPVLVSASAGFAPPNGTAFQWLTAWSNPVISYSHKANLANAGEAWTPVSLHAINSGVLAGGDLYGGLLGVSGRSANTSTVRQEIDGTEALRIELANGNHADAVVLDLARLFTDDAPGGLHEAGRVLFYDGNTLLDSRAFAASQANGKLHLEWSGLAPFTHLVVQAGAYDSNNANIFVPGGLVGAAGTHLQGPPGSGSDFLLEGVQFMDHGLPAAGPLVPPLELIGQPPLAAQAAVGFGG